MEAFEVALPICPSTPAFWHQHKHFFCGFKAFCARVCESMRVNVVILF